MPLRTVRVMLSAPMTDEPCNQYHRVALNMHLDSAPTGAMPGAANLLRCMVGLVGLTGGGFAETSASGWRYSAAVVRRGGSSKLGRRTLPAKVRPTVRQRSSGANDHCCKTAFRNGVPNVMPQERRWRRTVSPQRLIKIDLLLPQFCPLLIVERKKVLGNPKDSPASCVCDRNGGLDLVCIGKYRPPDQRSAAGAMPRFPSHSPGQEVPT